VQILLGANEALVFFLVGANESYVFALTREGFEWRTISLGEKNVSAKVAAFRRGLDVVELTKSVSRGKAQLFDLAAAHELYVALFGSVEALIKDKSQLLIVPSGPLTALPFHLLVIWPSLSSMMTGRPSTGQDSQGRQPGRSAHRDSGPIRVDRQSQSGLPQTIRYHESHAMAAKR
jgi:hypothetical protein